MLLSPDALTRVRVLDFPTLDPHVREWRWDVEAPEPRQTEGEVPQTESAAPQPESEAPRTEGETLRTEGELP
jgi:hypothetical protein